MNDREALMRNILDNPEDMTARLVFADWLEEHDEEDRARVIRLEIEADALGEESPRYDGLTDESATLWEAHPEWVADLQSHVSYFHTRRGFVEEIELDAVQFLEHTDELFGHSPINDVFFIDIRRRTKALAECRQLTRLKGVGFGENALGSQAAATVFASPYWSNIERIDVSENNIGTAGAKVLFSNPAFANLREVSMWACTIRAMGVRTLIEAKHLSKIEKLHLGDNVVDDRGVRYLCDAPHLQSVRDLKLFSNDITDMGMRTLARCEHFANLRQLNLHSNEYGDDGAFAIVTSPIAQHLESLFLRGSKLTGNVFAGIAHSKRLTNLVTLKVVLPSPTDASGLETLASNDALPSLRELVVSRGQMDELAWLALGRWKQLPRLESLTLGQFRCLRPDGMAGLLRQPLPLLKELNLGDNSLTDSSVETLARSPHLPMLESLDLSQNGIGEVGGRALLNSPHLQKLRSLELSRTSIPTAIQSELKERFGSQCRF